MPTNDRDLDDEALVILRDYAPTVDDLLEKNIHPELVPLLTVPSKYRKLEAGQVKEMTTNEKAAVDESEFPAIRVKFRNQVRRKTLQFIDRTMVRKKSETFDGSPAVEIKKILQTEADLLDLIDATTTVTELQGIKDKR